MAESDDETRNSSVQQIVFYYTKPRRQLPYFGTDASGAKIPGGPYTILQPIAAVLVCGLAWLTRPVWAADMSWLVSLIVVILVSVAAGYFAGMIDLTEQNPLFSAIGTVGRLNADPAGTLGGSAIRRRSHKPRRKPAITCAQPAVTRPITAFTNSVSEPCGAAPVSDGTEGVAGRPNPWIDAAANGPTHLPPQQEPHQTVRQAARGHAAGDRTRASGLESLLAVSRSVVNQQPTGRER